MEDNALYLMNKRLGKQGGDAEGRLIQDKLNTFKKALQYSYQAETIIFNGQEHRVLMNNNKLKLDYDDKIVSALHETGLKVGSIFKWKNIDENWIVTLRYFTENAYFRAQCRHANQSMYWTDENGIKRESIAATRGPVETKERNLIMNRIQFDEANYSLYLIVPKNEHTSKLKRYSKIMLSDRLWEITAADSVTADGVIEFNLIESYVNTARDDDHASGKFAIDYTVETAFDSNLEFTLGEQIHPMIKVYGNGQYREAMTKTAIITVEKGLSVTIKDNIITPVKVGFSFIKVSIPALEYEQTYRINVVDTPASVRVVKFIISGADTVRCGGESVYKLEKFINGNLSIADSGYWTIDNTDKCTIIESTPSTFKVRWNKNKNKTIFTLTYRDPEGEESHVITCNTLL